MLYVTHGQWDEFRHTFPRLLPDAKDAEQYRVKTSNTKGRLMQAYVEGVIREQYPDLEIISNHEYALTRGKCDIDLIVLGEKQKVLAAVGNPDYFKPVKQSTDVKRASARLQKAS